MKCKLEVKNLFKVFGGCPEEAMRLVSEGQERAEVFAGTGQSLAVNNASFSVYEGEIFVVMGLSGSGKSTLVRLLNRLIEPTRGQVLFDGVDIASMSESQLRELRRRHISMVFQSFALMPHLTVLQNVAFGLELAGEPRSERNQKAQKVLEQVGLGTHSKRFPHEFSGGMQLRVGLARALANDPSVLLMDEAFSALDPMTRAEMQGELKKLQRNDKRTVIFISHDIEEAFRISDRIAIMQDGVVVQVGTQEELVKQPRNDYVRSFFKNVDVTHVYSALDVSDMPAESLLDPGRHSPRVARAQLLANNLEFGYVVDERRKFLGIVSIASLDAGIELEGHSDLLCALLRTSHSVASTASVCSLYNTLANCRHDLPVVDPDGQFCGAINRSRVFELLGRKPLAAETSQAGVNEPDTCC